MRAGLHLKRLILLLGDYAVFQLSLVLTLVLRYRGGLTEHHWNLHALPFALLGLLWMASFYVAGLYDPLISRDQIRFFRAYLEGMIANLLVGLAFFYTIPFGIEPRTNLFLHFAIALLLGYAWRVAYNRFVAPRILHDRLLFIGNADDAKRVQELLKANAPGFELAAVIRTSGETTLPEVRSGEISQLENLVQEENIQTIVLGHRPDEIPGLGEALYKTLFSSAAIIDRARLEEAVTGRLPLDFVNQTWFLEHLRESDKTWYESLKRVVDVIVAIPFGLIVLALLPFVALAIKLSSPGPILYSQTRVGLRGSQFRIWKFRSMHTDAEKNGPQFTSDAKTDPRLFTVGRIMRQLRIDELPQIWNVLRGELSFVGPRPERPEFVTPLIERMPYYDLRHLTRPGLTGWAQVKFLTPNATLEDNIKKLQYDLFYIRHRSPLLDIAIFLRTIGIVLKRQGT